MKFSVITPVFNGQDTIRTCLESVLNQVYSDKEHIVVDGLSNDRTVEILKEYPVKWISDKDSGLYDAFNKGITMAKGDIICFLCADDMYAHNKVLQHIADVFSSHPEANIVYGDIVYVKRNNLSKIIRYWKSSSFRPGLFKRGWLPPNTALFIRRKIFMQYGSFNLRFKMAADYELQYRFFEKLKLKSVYVPGVLVHMRSGGVSNAGLRNIYKSLRECYQVLRLHNVKFPFIYILNTLLYRLKQVFISPEVKKK